MMPEIGLLTASWSFMSIAENAPNHHAFLNTKTDRDT
jgi:hypothetical protein